MKIEIKTLKDAAEVASKIKFLTVLEYGHDTGYDMPEIIAVYNTAPGQWSIWGDEEKKFDKKEIVSFLFKNRKEIFWCGGHFETRINFN